MRFLTLAQRVFLSALLTVVLLSGAVDPGWAQPTPAANSALATFAGGCFWCMEAAFDGVKGVISTTSGYTGGRTVNPTYKEVSSERTGHAEAVQVAYDPNQISYSQLLDIFWHNIDPLDAGGQFCDRGSSYRSGIFFHSPEQKQLAESSKLKITNSGRFKQKIVTEITAAPVFYVAEAYHQNYHQTNTLQYNFYRFACGRDQRLKSLWGEAAHPATGT